MLDVKRYPRESLTDEKGMVLVVALLLIAALVLLGTTAVMMSTTDMKISSNYKTANMAFYAAEAGLEEMRARLKGSLPDVTIIKDRGYPDLKWTAYILTPNSTSSDCPDYSAYNTASYKNYIPHSSSQTSTAVQSNTLQTVTPILPYCVSVKHKTEYDAELQGHTPSKTHYADLDGNTAGGHTLSAPGSIIYYGYRNSSSTTLEYFTSSSNPPKSRANPAEIIRSQGRASNGSAKVIEIEVRRPISTSVPAAVYGEVINGGGNVTVDGINNCASGNLPALAYVTSQTLCGGGSVSCLPSTNQTIQLPTALPLQDRVSALEKSKTDTLTVADEHPNLIIGSASDYRIAYCDATVLSDQQLNLNGVIGYGILVVKGDVYFAGNLNWHGLIIASGNVSFYGGGSDAKNIYGAVLSNTTATIQGSVNVKYDSCEIDKANQGMPPVITIWNEKSGS